MPSHRTPRALFPLALALALVACEEKSDEPVGGKVEIAALGVAVDLPPGWKHQEKRGEHWLTKSPMYGGRLSKTTLPESLDAAVAGWLQGEVKDKGEAGGGYWAVVEAEFPAAGDGEPMKLPNVFVVLPIGDGAIECGGQLQTGDDPGPLLEVCKKITAL